MKRPKLNALRTFDAAARHLNFSMAGEELGISQAAVSQQIRQLENYLDAKLFLRHNRGMSLTGLGEAYYLTVHESLDRLDTVTDQLFPRAQQRLITIQCTPSVATLWLIPRLASFRTDHPDVQLRVMTLGSEAREPGGPEIDMEIIIPGPGDTKEHCHPLIDVEIFPVCSPKLLEESTLSNPIDVTNHELIHVLGYNDDWHRWFRAFGLRKHTVPAGISFDGSLMALESTISDSGVMLGRTPFIDQYLLSGDLVRPFADNFVLKSTYYLRISPKDTRQKDRETVKDWVIAAAVSQAPKLSE